MKTVYLIYVNGLNVLVSTKELAQELTTDEDDLSDMTIEPKVLIESAQDYADFERNRERNAALRTLTPHQRALLGLPDPDDGVTL